MAPDDRLRLQASLTEAESGRQAAQDAAEVAQVPLQLKPHYDCSRRMR